MHRCDGAESGRPGLSITGVIESVGENDDIFHNDSDDTDVTGSHDKFAFDYVGKFVLGSVGEMLKLNVALNYNNRPIHSSLSIASVCSHL